MIRLCCSLACASLVLENLNWAMGSPGSVLPVEMLWLHWPFAAAGIFMAIRVLVWGTE